MIETKNAVATISYWGRTVDPDTKVRGGWGQIGEPTSAYVYYQPKTAGYVSQRYMLSTKNPAVILCELADADKFDPAVQQQGIVVQVEISGKAFYVVARPNSYQVNEDTDHATVVLESGRYPHE